jgi:predicted ATPase
VIFEVLSRGVSPASKGSANQPVCYLNIDNWDDYHFVTTFYVTIADGAGRLTEIGNVKIGYVGQKGEGQRSATYKAFGSNEFGSLGEGWFSMGTDVEYYSNLMSLREDLRGEYLEVIRDMAHDNSLIDLHKGEPVFLNSFMRSTSINTIREQFTRVLQGKAPLSKFQFKYRRFGVDGMADIEMFFQAIPESTPSSNVHAIIGRNGAGKTTILNDIVSSIASGESSGALYETPYMFIGEGEMIEKGYFSSLISISFSIFDPFTPPIEQNDPSLGTCYHYVGLKDRSGDEGAFVSVRELTEDFANTLVECMGDMKKRSRWKQAILTLQSDNNFRDMELLELMDIPEAIDIAIHGSYLYSRMSSGHAAVILAITKLVAKVDEKALVLIDEPESHLHPPLLSAFIRAVSELLYDRNGIAIIATHSPVVLQEIPKSCVYKIIRSRLEMSASRPDIETFGENVGTLTRDVFGLEVHKSGFHEILERHVVDGLNYDEIDALYNGQIGGEGKAILRSLIYTRGNSVNEKG